MILAKDLKSKVSMIRTAVTVAADASREYVDPELESAKPFDAMPKQSILPIEMLPGGKLFRKPIDEWHPYFYEKHGNIFKFSGMFGRPPFVCAYDPADIGKVYRYDSQWPHRTGFETWVHWRQQRKDLFKNFVGLVVEQGEAWHKYRTILNPVMMQPKTVSLYVPEIDAVAKDFIEVTKKSLDENKETPADYGVYIQRYTMEAIGTIAFETRLNVLEPQEGNKGTKLANLVNETFVLTFELEGKPSIWKLYKTPTFYKLMKVLDETTDLIKEYVDEAIERLEKEGSQKPKELHGVLYKLLKIDKEIAITMGIDMLSVGIDTTGSAIKSLLYLLAANPEKQQKLREECLKILPAKTDDLTAEKLKHMPYLRACMKEAQRVLPLVVGNARRLQHDMVLQGYRVPKGVDVFLPHGIMGLFERHFPQTKDFVPERWLKDQTQAAAVGCPHSKATHSFVYLPFGHGVRACIGKRFAELETSILTTRLIREFNISWHYPAPQTESHMIKHLKGDYKLRLDAI